MNILITGGNGYIGQYLANYFSGENVYITARIPKRENERRMILEEEDTIDGICEDIDVVIHTASMDERVISQESKKALLVNAYGTRKLYLDALTYHVKKFFYLSTFHVYGKVTEQIVTEESATEPMSDYGLTHLFAEQYLRQLHLHKEHEMCTFILRLTNGVGLPGFGVDKWYLAFNDFCRSAVREKRIVLKSNGLPRRDFIAIPDICTAVDALMRVENDFEVYNVSSQNTFSIREIALMVKRVYEKMTGLEVELIMPAATAEEIERVKDFTVSSRKLRMSGWKSEESIEKTIEKILEAELEGYR